MISTIPLSDVIDLHTFIRLQIQILYNEIQIKINDGNIRSSKSHRNSIELIRFLFQGLLSFEISLKNNLYFGGIPDRLITSSNRISFSLYNQSYLDEGLQGCIHKLFINGREIIFNNSQLIAQNIGENNSLIKMLKIFFFSRSMSNKSMSN